MKLAIDRDHLSNTIDPQGRIIDTILEVALLVDRREYLDTVVSGSLTKRLDEGPIDRLGKFCKLRWRLVPGIESHEEFRKSNRTSVFALGLADQFLGELEVGRLFSRRRDLRESNACHRFYTFNV